MSENLDIEHHQQDEDSQVVDTNDCSKTHNQLPQVIYIFGRGLKMEQGTCI